MTYYSFNLLFSQEQKINGSDWSINTEIKDSEYSLPTPLGCGIITSDKLIPENYNNFQAPKAGGWWIDKPFNTKIIRVTDTGEILKAWAQHRYSSVCAFNNTGDYFIVTHKDAEVWLHDGRNGMPIRHLKLFNTCCVWSMVDENLLYYINDNKLRSYNVITDEDRLVREFVAESGMDFGGNEGDISNDGGYVCFSSTNRTRWFVYDLFDDIKYDVLDVGNANLIDAAQISPSGKYVVIEYGFKAANDYQEGVGCCLHDAKTMAYIRNIYYPKTQHNDVGFDDDGDEAMFISDVMGDFSGAGPSAILSIKLETGEKKLLHHYDTTTWLAYHFSQRSCLNRHDYVFCGTYNKSNIDPNSESWKPYWNEVLAIPTDTTKDVVRLAHHRGNGMSPRPSVNRQGDRLLFLSNLNNLPVEWWDVFMITLEEPDTIPPLKPINLTISSCTYRQVTLSWHQPAEAEDEDLPRNYKIYRDSTLLGYTRRLIFTDTTVITNTEYNYRIFSVDESAVESIDCAGITIETGSDTEPPEITKVVPLGVKALAVHFNEEVELTTALDRINYSITGGVIIERLLLSCKKVVLIATSEQDAGNDYTIFVSGIRDASPNRNRMAGIISTDFVAKNGSEIAFTNFTDNFDVADTGHWEFRRPELWSYAADQDKMVFGTNTGDYTFPGPGRIGTYALVKDKIFTDFTMTCKARLVDSREFEFIWNYQDDYNYHYVMIHKIPRNNELFLLVDSMRYTITPFTGFTKLDDNEYHNIKVTAKSGYFTISFDDSVIVEGKDETFMYGKVGMGSFGGWVYFDDFSVIPDREFISLVEDENLPYLADIYKLNQNYPNPFNPITKFDYYLPKEEKVTFTIYNILGNEVDILVNNKKQLPGKYRLIWDASQLTSGIYFYELKAGNFFKKKKMILIK